MIKIIIILVDNVQRAIPWQSSQQALRHCCGLQPEKRNMRVCFSSKNIFDQGFTTCFFTSSTEIGRAVKVIFKKVKYLSYLVNCLLDNILPLSPTLPSWTLYKIIIIHYMPRKCFFFCVDKDIAHDSLMKSDSFGGSRNLEGGPGPKSWCLAKLSPPP